MTKGQFNDLRSAPVRGGAAFDWGLSGSPWQMGNPEWSRVHSVHEIGWMQCSEVFSEQRWYWIFPREDFVWYNEQHS